MDFLYKFVKTGAEIKPEKNLFFRRLGFYAINLQNFEFFCKFTCKSYIAVI